MTFFMPLHMFRHRYFRACVILGISKKDLGKVFRKIYMRIVENICVYIFLPVVLGHSATIERKMLISVRTVSDCQEIKDKYYQGQKENEILVR